MSPYAKSGGAIQSRYLLMNSFLEELKAKSPGRTGAKKTRMIVLDLLQSLRHGVFALRSCTLRLQLPDNYETQKQFISRSQ